MYNYLNCLPFGPDKIIKRIKLMRQKAHRRTVSTVKSKMTDRPIDQNKTAVLNSKYNGDLIDINGSKDIKLVGYSNLDVTINDQTTIKTKFVNEDKNEVIGELVDKKEIISRVNSTMLEKIVEENCSEMKEDTLIKQISIEDKTTVIKTREKDENLDDQILHELHANSLQNDSSNSTLSNQFCNLAKHSDNNTKDTTNQTDCFPIDNQHQIITTTTTTTTNDLISDDSIMDLDAHAVNEIQKNNDLSPKLINEIKLNLDENDSELTNDKQLISTNQSTNQACPTNDKQSTTNQLNDLTQATNKVTTVSKSFKPSSNQTETQFIDVKRKTNKKLIQDTDLRTNAILNGVETWIELNKGSNCALGLDLIDRTINDQKLFIIHEIMNQGIAETDQRLQIGDVILQVNDIPLKDMTCEQAIEHLNRTSGSVKLLVYRELICINDQKHSSNENLNESTSSSKPNSLIVNYSIKSTMQENERDENVEQKLINGRLYEIIQVELLKKTNKGLGLCIVDSDSESPGPYISEIIPNSIAHLEGRLRKGDHIVYVNGEDVSNHSITTTLGFMKCLQGLITLKVARLLPGQIVSLESFNDQQRQIESTPIKFKVVKLNPKIKRDSMINLKRKPMNDRVKELIDVTTKDTDSIGDISLLNETVQIKNESDNKSISENWIKIDKPKKIDNAIYFDQQLIDFGSNSIDELIKENKIIQINGQSFDNSNDQLVDQLNKKLNESSIIEMIVQN